MSILISRTRFENVHAPNRWLEIVNYDGEHYRDTYYAVRLGARAVSDEEAPIVEDLVIPAGGAVTVWSLEGFKLSTRVWGSVGAPTEWATRHLCLLHGPTLDPGFPGMGESTGGGSLRLAIVNHSAAEVRLPPLSQVAKVTFFDMGADALERDQELEHVRQRAWAPNRATLDRLEESMDQLNELREALRKTFPDDPHMAGPDVGSV